MEPWRFLQDGAQSPPRNMAIDEALLRCAVEPVLRLYRFDQPAQSLGYFQEAAVALPGPEMVRRYTGGGLVDHRHDVTYTIVLPIKHRLLKLSMPESYSAIHAGVVKALQVMGYDATLAADPDDLEHAACFQKAVKYDVKIGGTKVAGAAQRRTRQGMLHQGSVLLPEPKRNDEFWEALPRAMAGELLVGLSESELTEKEQALADEFEKTRYGNREWVYQR